MQAGYVFSEDVKLKVDHRAHLDITEVGVCTGVRNDGHLESVVGGIADREGNAVYGYRPLVYREVSAPRHVGIELVFKLKVSTSVGIPHADATGCLVNMTLDDVPVQPPVHRHGAFHIDGVSNLEEPQIRAVEGFFHGCNGIGVVRDSYYGETYAVMGDALVNFQFVHKRTSQGEIDVALRFIDCREDGHFFYDTAKHMTW